jgi:hypothetical protein
MRERLLTMFFATLVLIGLGGGVAALADEEDPHFRCVNTSTCTQLWPESCDSCVPLWCCKRCEFGTSSIGACQTAVNYFCANHQASAGCGKQQYASCLPNPLEPGGPLICLNWSNYTLNCPERHWCTGGP